MQAESFDLQHNGNRSKTKQRLTGRYVVWIDQDDRNVRAILSERQWCKVLYDLSKKI